jgi:hypothetical protein
MWKKTLIMTLFTLVLIGVQPVLYASEAYTDVYVDPPTKDVFGLETEFTVDLSITNASDVCGWEFKLYYSGAVLNATLLTEGPFLASAGSTYLYVNTFTDTYNTTHGLIHAACTLIGPGPGADGNGTLATLTFKTKNPGDTPLTLQDTIIIDSNETPIPHTTHHATIHFPIVIDAYTQKGGIGLGKPSDAYPPGSTIIVYGLVVYNEAPLPGVLVQFVMYDPLGSPTVRTATTNQDGLATSSIILSSTCLFGNYTIVATTEIQQELFDDTVPLRVGWIVSISQLTCCDEAGSPQASFAKNKVMYLNITLESIALTQRPLVLLIDVTDELGNRINCQWIQFMIPAGKAEMIIGFRVPPWSVPGTGQIRADAYTNLPSLGGTVYCPGKTVNFIIVSG